MLLAFLLTSTVLSTLDLCAKPIQGGRRDPQFYRFPVETIVHTPYFSITVEPNMLVGVYDSGRRMNIQNITRQDQIHLRIDVYTAERESEICLRFLHYCQIEELTDRWVICDRPNIGDFVERVYVQSYESSILVINLDSSPLALGDLKLYEKMVGSIESKES